MSGYLTGGGRHLGRRRRVALVGVLVGLALIVGGGTLLPRRRQPSGPPGPLVGRTTTICSVAAPESGDTATASVSAVATRRPPAGRAG